MCGIAGMVAMDNKSQSHRLQVKLMCDSIAHRGPDGEGQWDDGYCYFGHRRLSILDLTEAAAQPFKSEDGRFILIYNGEIYNYFELREQLKARGYNFESSGDTEVLLKWLIEFGKAGIAKLNGIFAFAFYDCQEKELLLVRDHFGVKPLYYHWDGERLFFGSEVKCIAAGGVPISFDPGTLDELMTFRFTAGERTTFTNIKRLLPGNWLQLKAGRMTTQTYWSLFKREISTNPTYEEYAKQLDQSIFEQRIADVPIGILLSGGLDSSSVLASLATQGQTDLKAFNISFDEPEFDEHPDAKVVAERYGAKLYSERIPPNKVVELFRRAHKYKDEPYAHANDAFIYHISVLAKQHVKVLLSGEGADETLAGYVRYRPLSMKSSIAVGSKGYMKPFRMAANAILPRNSARLRKLIHFLELGSIDQIGFYNSINVLPKDIEKLLGFKIDDPFTARHEIWESARVASTDILHQTMLYDQATFMVSLLDRNDRMTMGASIECRVPFLSVGVTEVAAGFSSSDYFDKFGGKQPLRYAMNYKLPKQILHKRKWGFGVPWRDFFKTDKDCRQLLDSMRDSGMPWAERLGRKGMSALFEHYNKGDESAMFLIYELFFLELWAQERLSSLRALSAEARKL